MLQEAVEAIQARPGGRFVDGTIGGGGHAEAILAASHPNGFLYGSDRDSAALEAARKRLGRFEGRFELRQCDFSELGGWIEPNSCDGMLLDLGVSSPQLDWAERGFSFQSEGPLDMRLDQRAATSAADLVNELSEAELAKIFWELGDEPQGRRIARAIVLERQARRIETTTELARLVERVVPRGGKRHPATRVFLALRMVVNDEMGSLKSGLAVAWALLRKSGRLAIITFHSVEDRLVKEFGRTRSRGYVVEGNVDLPEFRRSVAPELRLVNRKPVKPQAAEIESNARARSAQLRVFEKL